MDDLAGENPQSKHAKELRMKRNIDDCEFVSRNCGQIIV